MHYYSFHVSDYIHDTAHLSLIEDLAFRRLLDLYYTSEKPIPNRTHEVSRRIRMSEHEDIVQTVLEEFFTFNTESDFWYHKRCDETIMAYQAKAQRNREVGKLGGRPKANPEETQMVSKVNPNQEPITINHKPKVESTRGSRLSPDFCLTEEWKDFCQQDRPDLNPSKVFETFKDYWVAKAGQQGVKLDWFATWRNWVRSQNQAPVNKADQVFTTVPSRFERDPALIDVENRLKQGVPMPPEIRLAMERLRK
jgi:uncharacterized protein YdaU (DUF1376 family)